MPNFTNAWEVGLLLWALSTDMGWKIVGGALVAAQFVWFVMEIVWRLI